MVKFCPECANPIVESNMPFCPKCGAKLPITSPDVNPSENQPPSAQQPAQQLAQPSYNTTLSSITPTTVIESKGDERSFYYSNIFYIVIILDFIISFLFGIVSFVVISNMTSSGYQNPVIFFFLIIYLINLILDVDIINKMKRSPHTIDIHSCWIKCLFGFLGIFTFISGLYFLIISISMKRAYDASIK